MLDEAQHSAAKQGGVVGLLSECQCKLTLRPKTMPTAIKWPIVPSASTSTIVNPVQHQGMKTGSGNVHTSQTQLFMRMAGSKPRHAYLRGLQ